MKNKRRILVSGVSGVGKTTLCADFCKENPSVAHLEASRLARELHVGFSQEDVVRVIMRELDSRPECSGLVDGHLIVRDTKVPVNAIRMLSPHAIVVIVDEPYLIEKRRNSDSSRTRERESIQKIRRVQKNEIAYAGLLADMLNVRCIALETSQKLEFSRFAKRELLSGLYLK